MPELEAIQGDAALVPVANAQQIADEFAAQVLSILREKAQTKGNAETAATATILMSVAVRTARDWSARQEKPMAFPRPNIAD
jgi:hypothetical protein